MNAKVRAKVFDTPWKQVGAKRPQVLPWVLETKLNTHLDVVSTHWLYNLTQPQLEELAASCLHPAIGSYHDHASMSDRTVQTREGEWKDLRVQEGTIRETGGKGARDRQLMAFTVSGPATYLKQLVIPSESIKELMCKTCPFDPNTEEMAAAKKSVAILKRRNETRGAKSLGSEREYELVNKLEELASSGLKPLEK